MVALQGNTDQEGAYLLGAFQAQTFFGKELVLASFADPFEDGNPVGDASWDAQLRRDSSPDNPRILVEACTEVVAVVAVAGRLRTPPPLPMMFHLLLVLGEVGPVEEEALHRKVLQDTVDAWA
jgi:hypothetical protein